MLNYNLCIKDYSTITTTKHKNLVSWKWVLVLNFKLRIFVWINIKKKKSGLKTMVLRISIGLTDSKLNKQEKILDIQQINFNQFISERNRYIEINVFSIKTNISKNEAHIYLRVFFNFFFTHNHQ